MFSLQFWKRRKMGEWWKWPCATPPPRRRKKQPKAFLIVHLCIPNDAVFVHCFLLTTNRRNPNGFIFYLLSKFREGGGGAKCVGLACKKKLYTSTEAIIFFTPPFNFFTALKVKKKEQLVCEGGVKNDKNHIIFCFSFLWGILSPVICQVFLSICGYFVLFFTWNEN